MAIRSRYAQTLYGVIKMKCHLKAKVTNMFPGTLKAGALLYAILLSVLVCGIMASVMLFQQYSQFHFMHRLRTEQLISNVHSALNLAMNDRNLFQQTSVIELDLFGEGTDSVAIRRRPWGLYSSISVAAHSRELEYTRSVLSGVIDHNLPVLYLSDRDKPLSLCGNTLIRGRAVIPKAGFKRAYIEGRSFQGNRFCDGKVEESSRNLPELKPELLDGLKAALWSDSSPEDSIVTELPDSVWRSFSKSTIHLQSNGLIQIRDRQWSGNVIVQSKTRIEVHADAVLDNVFLIAPIVEFEHDFSGKIQVLASDSILTGKGCTFLYPSSFVTLSTKEHPSPSVIRLDEDCKLEGSLLSWMERINLREFPVFTLNARSEIVGWVYCNGFSDIKGRIEGSLFTQMFLLKTPAAVYENHLLGATLDATSLPSHFAGPSIFPGYQPSTVMSWLE